MYAHPVVLLLAAALQPQLPNDGEPPPSAQQSAVYYTSGVGAPLGIAGIEGVHRFSSIFEISAGAGIGLGASLAQPHAGLGQVLQWSVMPRLRLGGDRGGITFGAGLSGGGYGALSSITDPLSYFLWSNFEVGVEDWWKGGFALRLFGGYAHGWCVSSACVSGWGDFPYLGFGLGYAF